MRITVRLHSHGITVFSVCGEGPNKRLILIYFVFEFGPIRMQAPKFTHEFCWLIHASAPGIARVPANISERIYQSIRAHNE